MTLFDVPGPEPDPPPAAPEGPLVRVRLLVAYRGTGFRGFAAQRGQRTVAGELAAAIERSLRQPVELTCAGRTDAGVHAWGQVVHFDVVSPEGAEPVDLERLQRGVNKMCAPDVVVREATLAADGFDARHSAVARRYRYIVLNRPVPDPLRADTTWHVPEALDLAAMRLACDPILGSHDFAAFCRQPRVEGATTVRRVHDARWLDLGDGELRFDIEANAFCHQMVRSLVGVMVDVGRGRLRAADVAMILRRADRSRATTVAPPHGLVLWEVVY